MRVDQLCSKDPTSDEVLLHVASSERQYVVLQGAKIANTCPPV